MSTDPTPGTSYDYETTLEATKPRRWPWIAGIVAALVLGYGAGAASDDTTPAADVEPEAAVTVEKAADEPAEKPGPAPEPEPEPEFDEPTADDFELTVKTLEKACFGSAGCNVTFRIEVALVDPLASFDPDKTYELTYEITNSEDPYINTLTIQGDEYETQQEEFVGTASDVELKAVVTAVSER